MLHVYYSDITEAHHFCESDLLKQTSNERKQKIEKYLFSEDKLRSLYGEALIRYCSSIHHVELNLAEPFAFTKYGKPFFPDRPNFHFNLSHSGKYVICAVSNQSVGVDIEERASLNILSLLSALHLKEITLLKQNNNQQALFFDIWTLKESYLKFLGTGLSLPLHSFYVDLDKGKISPPPGVPGIPPKVQLMHIHSDYSCAVCSQLDEPYTITQVSLNELYQQLL